MKTIVVTGTDTDVGKTVFAAGLTRFLEGCYWKPVQAGLVDGGDAATVAMLSGLAASRILPERYRLTTPCSPHRAAEIDGVEIDAAAIVPPACDRPLIIEGAGGALVPLTRDVLYADLFARWQIPVIVVARTDLGTINHSLLTIEALRSRRVPILGVAFTGAPNEDSEQTIAGFGKVRRLGCLPRLAPLTSASLASAFAAAFDRSDFA